MNRKVISFLLALIMIFSVCAMAIPVSAAGDEVINSTAQGKEGTYVVAKTGYYLINLRGGNGGGGDDVKVETDGAGSTGWFANSASAEGGLGTEGGNVSTLVYLRKGQNLIYKVGADGKDYKNVIYTNRISSESGTRKDYDTNYAFANVTQNYYVVRPNTSKNIKGAEYFWDEFTPAGMGGGGGEASYVKIGNVIIAGAAGGGGGGGAAVGCPSWSTGSAKKYQLNGGNATAVSATISTTFTSLAAINGEAGGDSYATIIETTPGEASYLDTIGAGAGGKGGTSYINLDEDFYRGNNVPAEVASNPSYKNATVPTTSGVVVTFVGAADEQPVSVVFRYETGEEDTYNLTVDTEPFDISFPKHKSASGYFKAWQNIASTSDAWTKDYYNKDSGTININYGDFTNSVYEPTFYSESGMGTSGVSAAKAQAVTMSSGQKVIRFLAAVDGNYASYKRAGFVITANYPTPTMEAGFQYSKQYGIYQQVKANNGLFYNVYTDEAKAVFGLNDMAGIFYANLIIESGNENTTYYATPYVVKNNGDVIYGNAKAISYNELKALDAQNQ